MYTPSEDHYVTVLRGPSGAGKTTWRKYHKPSAFVCSADHFFNNPTTGEYEFDVKRLSEAHSWCMSEYLQALRAKRPCIVVDNTNIKEWEFQNYLQAAELAFYKMTVVEFFPRTVDECRLVASRGRHGVPRQLVHAMSLDYTPFPVDRFKNVTRVCWGPVVTSE